MHVFEGRLSAAAVTASLLVAGALLLLPFTVASAQAQTGCDDADLTVLPSPVAPWKGAPLRVMVVTEKSADGVLSLVAPDGSVAAKSDERHGGPPYFWFAEVEAPAAGTWHAQLARASSECGAVSREIISGSQQAGAATHAGGQFLAGAQ